MPTPTIRAELLQEALDAVYEYGTVTKAAEATGIKRNTLSSRYLIALRSGKEPVKPSEFKIAILPEEINIDELVSRRKQQFKRKKIYEDASKLIGVDVKEDGPIGILHFGDPHVDDDGTDIEALERHARLVRKTPGLFAVNVGDTTNNWCGRLARLYAEQSTSAAEAWELAKWFVGLCPWLYMIGGNHDLWSGAGDPMKWIAQQNNALYKSSEARIELRFPSKRTVRVNARHDFAGHSQYNVAHGSTKALMFGLRDHIAIAGHKHESGYNVLKDQTTGITMHSIKVASYKIFDRYAKEKGFRDHTVSPCVVTTINPGLPETHPDMIKVWWDPEEAAQFLTWQRKRAA